MDLGDCLMNTCTLSEIGASDCFLNIKTSGEFNPALVSEISSSLVSQYIRENQVSDSDPLEKT